MNLAGHSVIICIDHSKAQHSASAWTNWAFSHSTLCTRKL